MILKLLIGRSCVFYDRNDDKKCQIYVFYYKLYYLKLKSLQIISFNQFEWDSIIRSSNGEILFEIKQELLKSVHERQRNQSQIILEIV